MKKFLLIAAAMAAMAGPAMAGVQYDPRAPCEKDKGLGSKFVEDCVKWRVKMEKAWNPHNDESRFIAMRAFMARSGPWACVTQDAYGDEPAYQDCGFGYGRPQGWSFKK